MIKPTSITALQTFFFIGSSDFMVASIQRPEKLFGQLEQTGWARCTAARYLRKNTSQHLRRTTGIETERKTDHGPVQIIVSICRRTTRHSKSGAGRTAAI